MSDAGHPGGFVTAGRQVFAAALVPHGYTLTMWLAAIVLTSRLGTPTPLSALLFELAATAAVASSACSCMRANQQA